MSVVSVRCRTKVRAKADASQLDRTERGWNSPKKSQKDNKWAEKFNSKSLKFLIHETLSGVGVHEQCSVGRFERFVKE